VVIPSKQKAKEGPCGCKGDGLSVEMLCLVNIFSFLSFQLVNFGFGLWYLNFNATFNNISVISWQSVLLVEETGVRGENHRPGASH
jgi:hypothetical protein